jgi:HemY protein
MRGVIWLLLLFIVAVVAATLLGRNDNLVTLYWAPWRVDLSFNLFMVALIAFCLVFMTLVRTITALVGLPRRARAWRVQRRDRVAQAALREALSQYFGGRYSRSHKAAQRAVTIQTDTPELEKDNEFAVLGHLLAAGSLHRLQDRTRRDEELERAFELTRGSAAARTAEEGARLLAAEWALDDRDARRTLDLLAGLPPGVARRTQALRLKLQAARLAEEPMEALRTARLLAKHQGFSPVAAQGLIRSLAIEMLGTARDAGQLERAWRELDASDRRDVHVAAYAARQLARCGGAQEEARSWLRPFWERITLLERDERDTLALALADTVEGIGPEWLPRLDAALQACPGEPALVYAMGRALLARQIWGKARQMLEEAGGHAELPAAARREAWLRLAELAEHDGDAERAAMCFRSAASVA